jgi:hypothetical protein
MTYRQSSTAQVLALAIFAAAALRCAQAGDMPKSYILVNWSNVSELRIEEEIDGAYVPAAPTAEDLIAADPPCEEMLRVADQLNLSSAGIYDKVQPFEQEKPPLTPAGKFKLAIVNTVDPFNMATASADAAFSAWTSSSSSAYGRGGMAFAKRFGTDMTDELSGEFFQAFMFPAIFGQDPHYHRDVMDKTPNRVRYALLQVFVTRSDKGNKIFNFGEVFGNFAAASLGNLYHSDRAKGFGPTSARIGVSIASDAAWNLFTEFWPDVTRHMNFRMVFLRRLAERAARQN